MHGLYLLQLIYTSDYNTYIPGYYNCLYAFELFIKPLQSSLVIVAKAERAISSLSLVTLCPAKKP